MSTHLELKIGETDEDEIKLGSDTLKDLNLSEGDLCEVIFPTTMSSVLARVKRRAASEEGEFIANEELASQLGVYEGFECELSSYDNEIKELDVISLKLEGMGEKDVDVDSYMTEKTNEVISKITDKYINQNSKIEASELGIYIEVEETDPVLSSGEFGTLKEDTKLKFSKKYKDYFNGILLIDSSKSMSSTRKEKMMKPLKNDAFLENLSTQERIKDYISDKIEEKDRITKLDAAILAVLAFLSAKVSQGRGEGLSIILWSEEAIPLNFVVSGNKKVWVSAREIGQKDTLAELIASELLSEADKISSRNTNMEKAIKKAREIRNEIVEEEEEEFEKPYPTMIIFLTDGKRTAGRSPVNIVKEEIAPLEKTILHTIGLGNDVEEDQLIAMAQATGGKYFNTRNVKKLIEFYDKEASNFSSVETEIETEVAMEKESTEGHDSKEEEDQENLQEKDDDIDEIFDKLRDLKV